nr:MULTISPECIES: MurR/RpiR family transcriptional regulator [unclassified Thermoactinomyces]
MIAGMLEQLPPSERKIAAYILQHPHEALNQTVHQLGVATNTSSAAVIRLCKSLGLRGFGELKMRIAGDLLKSPEQGYRDIDPDESMYSIVQKLTNNSLQSLRDTADIINYEELERAVQVLLKAKNIHFFGVGASGIIAADAQQKLLRINKAATAFSDLHLVATLLANADEQDVLFAISFSGETPEVVKIVTLAKEQRIPTISLTNYGVSTVSSLSDIRLHTSYQNEAPFRSAAASSRLAQLHMIDILFFCLATAQYEQTVKSIDKTREAIRKLTGKNKR